MSKYWWKVFFFVYARKMNIGLRPDPRTSHHHHPHTDLPKGPQHLADLEDLVHLAGAGEQGSECVELGHDAAHGPEVDGGAVVAGSQENLRGPVPAQQWRVHHNDNNNNMLSKTWHIATPEGQLKLHYALCMWCITGCILCGFLTGFPIFWSLLVQSFPNFSDHVPPRTKPNRPSTTYQVTRVMLQRI